VCGRELFDLLRVSMWKFEKVLELLKVSTLNFEMCGREVCKFQMCQRKFFAIVVSFK
jgi:hypothetical protein